MAENSITARVGTGGIQETIQGLGAGFEPGDLVEFFVEDRVPSGALILRANRIDDARLFQTIEKAGDLGRSSADLDRMLDRVRRTKLRDVPAEQVQVVVDLLAKEGDAQNILEILSNYGDVRCPKEEAYVDSLIQLTMFPHPYVRAVSHVLLSFRLNEFDVRENLNKCLTLENEPMVISTIFDNLRPIPPSSGNKDYARTLLEMVERGLLRMESMRVGGAADNFARRVESAVVAGKLAPARIRGEGETMSGWN